MIASISLKEGVKLTNLTPRMMLGALILAEVFRTRSIPCVITSGCDSTLHMKTSKHYQGDALDIRLPSRYSTETDIDQKVLAELKSALQAPKIFDVVLEKDHIHVEFDPKE